jgi:galactokinase
MVEIAQSAPGVIGARMTGGGFAGAAVAMVETATVHDFVAEVEHGYSNRSGVAPTLYIVRPGPGASLVAV